MTSQENKDIGLRVRNKREELHMSREKLAEKISISSRFLSDIELGNKGMSQHTLITICETLHTTPNYILLGIKPNQDENELVQIVRSIQPKYQAFIRNILLSLISELEEL